MTTHAFGMRVAIRVVVLTALAWFGLFGVASRSDATLLTTSQLYSKYATYDAARYDGLGYSQWKQAETLAWSEAYILQDYIHLYTYSKDQKWLYQITRHMDEMIKTMSDHDGDGYKGWQTDEYSYARVAVTGDTSTGSDLTPTESWIFDASRKYNVTGHTYKITFILGLAYAIQDLDTGAWLVKAAPFSTTITGIPEVTLKLSGLPIRGDTFTVKTYRPVMLEHMVHEGMILAPVARFIEIAYKTSGMDSTLKSKATTYLNLFNSNFIPKWDAWWREYSGGIGLYIEPNKPERWGAGLPLPHNQYLMHAEMFICLNSAVPNAILLDRATKMFAYFRSRLIATGGDWQTGGAWTWYYRDVYQDSRRTGPYEDTGHGSLDISAAIEARKRLVVIGGVDIMRFVNTALKQMWNGSLTTATFGDYVNTKSVSSNLFPIREWVELGTYDRTVYEGCLNIFERQNQPMKLIPTMLAAGVIAKPAAAPAMLPSEPVALGSLSNYPNPFNPETWIPFRLEDDSDVSVEIYDARGARVRTLDMGHLRSGEYVEKSRAAHWDGTNDSGESVASGVYFYRFRKNGEMTDTRRMVISK